MSTIFLLNRWLFALVTALGMACIAMGDAAPTKAPAGLSLTLFASTTELNGPNPAEFVVKVSSDRKELVRLHYDPTWTHVLQNDAKVVDPKDRWTLRLVVDVEGSYGIMNLSGLSHTATTEARPGEHSLVLLTPPGKRLPGQKLRVWAEVRSPDGATVTSNRIALRRTGN